MSTLIKTFQPDYTIHPGLSLKRALSDVGMTQQELSVRIDRPEKTISGIINGNVSLTAETAIQLERALGIPASFWNNLEKNFQEFQARKEAESTLITEAEIAKNYPYKNMAKNGWVPKTNDNSEKVRNLLNFFRVNSLNLIDDLISVQFRQYSNTNISKEAVQAWLRQGEIESREIKAEPFNKSLLNERIKNLKKHSTLDPSSFSKKLENELAECGVTLVFTKDLPRTYISGATRWLTPEKALIQLSLRGRSNDRMWFTLYHEIAHILKHSKKQQFIEWRNDKVNGSDEEKEANRFAADMLIPNDVWNRFIESENYDESSIKAFAEYLSIHPAIVVGRLQYEEIIPFNSRLNSLKDRYVIKEGN